MTQLLAKDTNSDINSSY